MAEKPSYEELEQRVKRFLEETARRNRAEEELRQAKGMLEGQLKESRSELSAISASLETEISRRERAEQEILQYKRAEGEIERQKELLHVILRSIGDGVIITDVRGRVLLVNKIAEKLTGRTQEEACGKPLHEIFHVLNEETRQRYQDSAGQLVDSGRIGDLRSHTALLSKDGIERIISNTGAPIKNEQGATVGTVLVFRDITEKARIEAQLLRSQKREAIGTLACGIAHDFNNILSAVIGYTELALLDTKKDTEMWSNLGEILNAGLRGRDLAKRVLAFTRETEQQKKPLKISTTIREAMALIRGVLPTTVEIQLDIQVESDVTLADPTQIHQVLMNLCTNAAHAMRNEGQLTVSLTRVDLDSEAVAQYPHLSPGCFLKMTVSDTGHGMRKEVIDRIFDPFFTTKGPGEGSGMGLAVVHGIIRTHDGAVTVSSELGKGATFHVLLPRLEREVASMQEIIKPIATGLAHVLFVDDEPGIVSSAKQLLERLGYEVSGRTSSIEALEAFRAQPHRFDLVITDMTMPNMTGVDLSREISRIRKDIPIILCTGFSEAIDPDKAKKVGISEMLTKPILAKDLRTTILKILGKE